MTREEADKIFDQKGEEYFVKLQRYIYIEEDYEKAINFFAEVTGCELNIARESILDSFPKIEKVHYSAVRCPYCNSAATVKNVKVDLLGDMILGENMFLREPKQWHCCNCGSDF